MYIALHAYSLQGLLNFWRVLLLVSGDRGRRLSFLKDLQLVSGDQDKWMYIQGKESRRD